MSFVKTTTIPKNLGNVGEKIANKFLMKHGHKILKNNFLTRYGEIDIITYDSQCNLHFIEVKTVSRKTFNKKTALGNFVLHETNLYQPNFNLSFRKISRLCLATQIYLAKQKPNYHNFQIDALLIVILPTKEVKITWLKNINC